MPRLMGQTPVLGFRRSNRLISTKFLMDSSVAQHHAFDGPMMTKSSI